MLEGDPDEASLSRQVASAGMWAPAISPQKTWTPRSRANHLMDSPGQNLRDAADAGCRVIDTVVCPLFPRIRYVLGPTWPSLRVSAIPMPRND